MTLLEHANNFWDFIDRRQVIRRCSFLWMLWITSDVISWTVKFLSTTTRPGGEAALMVAAIWTPLAALQGCLFKFYDQAQAAGGSERSSTQRRSDDNSGGT